MARRDYKNEPRPAEKRGAPVRILLIGVFLGLIVAAVMAWYLLPREGDFRKIESAPEMRAPPTSISTTSPKAPAPAEPPAAQPDPSNYTFYDILPGDKTPRPQAATAGKEQWWLQVAALKSAQDADALRARLTLLNLNVAVQATTGEPPLHRVRVGPFASQDAAESAQQTLVVNKFEPRLLKETAK